MGSYAFFSAIALIVSSAERKHDIAQLPKATKKSKIANRTKRNSSNSCYPKIKRVGVQRQVNDLTARHW